MDGNESSWLNYHLYYHEDLEVAILQFVRPLAIELVRSGWVDRFFFIRFGLGGPHIRLRLHPLAGATALVAETAENRARKFLTDRPSTSKLDAEVILRGNRELLAFDPHEFDASVYPDNAFLCFPFRPEIERYGGPELWEYSADFFGLSSVTILEMLANYGREPRSRRLVLAFRALLCQALNFSREQEDLMPLVRYAVDIWGENIPRAIARANRIFGQEAAILEKLFERELCLLKASPNTVMSAREEAITQLGKASRVLSWEIGIIGRDVRLRIGTSQLHMTANRLGFNNAEEVYLSQLLSRVAARLLESDSMRGLIPTAHFLPQPGKSTLRALLPEVHSRLIG